jgi:hypothetical protein
MVAHGTKRVGEQHQSAKLMDADIALIRANPDKLSGRALAKKYGVSQSLISLVRSGKHRK